LGNSDYPVAIRSGESQKGWPEPAEIMKKIVMLVSCLLLQAWSVAAPARETGIWPDCPDRCEDTRRRWQPLLDDLSKATGMDVQVMFPAATMTW
jgi:ABC-type phosphate/phosphonate transport system substrate-binding protein